MFVQYTSITVTSPKGQEKAPLFQIAGEQHRMNLSSEVEPAILSRLSHPEDCFTGLTQLAELLKNAQPELAQARHQLSHGSTRVGIDLGKQSPWIARLAESGALELRSPVHPDQISGEQCLRLYHDQATLCTSPQLKQGNAAHELEGQWNPQGTITCTNQEIDYTLEVQPPQFCTRFTPMITRGASQDT